MKRLRTAVVGPGRIAYAHLVAIRNNPDVGELAVVVGLPAEESRTRQLAAEFGAKRASNSLDDVLADPEIDAVILTLPNQMHAPIAMRALKAGKHVLVEKPLSNTVEEADDMIRAAIAANRTLMVAQCRRFFPGARETKTRVKELGRPLDIVHILGVDVSSAKADWWKSAASTGGLVLGLNGPHVIDTILWLMGESPIRVYAQTGRLKKDNWEGEDQATVVMTFADGSTATGHLSFNMRPDTNERWITGPRGTMHLVHDRTLWIDEKKIVEGKMTPYIEGDEAFDNQFKEFASAIRDGRPPLASAEEVRPVVRVLVAASESAKLNQPVELTP
jgi:UDP-N-acetylglucosamine 3-dehydrogenase